MMFSVSLRNDVINVIKKDVNGYLDINIGFIKNLMNTNSSIEFYINNKKIYLDPYHSAFNLIKTRCAF